MSEWGITRPVLRYLGGKFSLRNWIVELMPEHDVYVEPFGGAASVLFAKPRVRLEVYNDLDDALVRTFRVLRSESDSSRLADLIRLTPYARAEYESALEPDDLASVQDDVEVARLLIVRGYMTYGAISSADYRKGFRAPTATKLECSSWARFPESIRLFCERLRGVFIEHRPAEEVMVNFDGPTTLHYVDPPYVAEARSERSYAHELGVADHRRLAAVLHGLEGAVLLSGYDSPLYRELFPRWHVYSRGAHAHWSESRTELIWSNRKLDRQLDLLGGVEA